MAGTICLSKAARAAKVEHTSHKVSCPGVACIELRMAHSNFKSFKDGFQDQEIVILALILLIIKASDKYNTYLPAEMKYEARAPSFPFLGLV